MTNHTYYCIKCKWASKGGTCPGKHQLRDAGYRWRPPKKNNNKAWLLIAKGDLFWDKRYIDRKLRRFRLVGKGDPWLAFLHKC